MDRQRRRGPKARRHSGAFPPVGFIPAAIPRDHEHDGGCREPEARAMMGLADRALVLNPNYARRWHITGYSGCWRASPTSRSSVSMPRCASVPGPPSLDQARPAFAEGQGYGYTRTPGFRKGVMSNVNFGSRWRGVRPTPASEVSGCDPALGVTEDRRAADPDTRPTAGFKAIMREALATCSGRPASPPISRRAAHSKTRRPWPRTKARAPRSSMIVLATRSPSDEVERITI
jgi:hypothetical protein